MTVDWQRLDAILDRLEPAMIEVRRHLHAHPESRGEERQTARFLAERLAAVGLPVRPVADQIRNDPALTALIRQTATDLLGPQQVHEIARPSMGGEDFANYLQDIPGRMFRSGCCSQASGCPPCILRPSTWMSGRW